MDRPHRVDTAQWLSSLVTPCDHVDEVFFVSKTPPKPPVDLVAPLFSPTEPDAAHAAMPLLLKRVQLQHLLSIGRTLSIELHTPGHRNFDPVFPKPVHFTEKGPAFFVADEVLAWVEHLKHVRDGTVATAANDAQFALAK
ncbi:hypothetical protein [Acidovorax sp.]|jgi:hypothetical protein|uniref:hypothetical protein n=1 Tax=Acidovorax sp. TaxID=1872122 RepID=UPI0031D78986